MPARRICVKFVTGWPATLTSATKRQVMRAGVGGYSFDEAGALQRGADARRRRNGGDDETWSANVDALIAECRFISAIGMHRAR